MNDDSHGKKMRPNHNSPLKPVPLNPSVEPGLRGAVPNTNKKGLPFIPIAEHYHVLQVYKREKQRPLSLITPFIHKPSRNCARNSLRQDEKTHPAMTTRGRRSSPNSPQTSTESRNRKCRFPEVEGCMQSVTSPTSLKTTQRKKKKKVSAREGQTCFAP